MHAQRCILDPMSDRCAECAMFGDCLDEELNLLPEEPADGPLKVILPMFHRRDRRRYEVAM